MGSGNLGVHSSGATTAKSVSVKVSGLPTNGAKVYARLFSDIGGDWEAADYTYTAAKTTSAAESTAKLSELSCSTASLTGSAKDTCTVTLTGAAPRAGESITLSSNSSAVKVPATVKISSGSKKTTFTATAEAVESAETATIKASAASTSKTYAVSLKAAKSVLTVSATSVAFGDVPVHSTESKSVTLTSSGASALTISADTLSGGSGFTLSGAKFPLTLDAGKTATLTISYDPSAAGSMSGKLTLTSNSSTGSTATIALSGTGTEAALSGISCHSATITGSGTDACNVTLTTPAASGGFGVKLASSDSAVKVPASVTVAAGSTSASFTATASAVTTAQKATLTAVSGSVSKTYAVLLDAATPALSLSASSLSFGDVVLKTPATQSLVLTSSGTAPLTISAVKLTGTSFTMSGMSFPLTLNPGEAATLEVEFDPTATGAVAGTVTLTSNASSGAAAIRLSGTGEAAQYSVKLSWEPPSNSAEPIAGYNIYAASTGSSQYELRNSSPVTSTSYTDTNVVTGDGYNYEVMSVDTKGVQSPPSNVFTVKIP